MNWCRQNLICAFFCVIVSICMLSLKHSSSASGFESRTDLEIEIRMQSLALYLKQRTHDHMINDYILQNNEKNA